MSNYQATGGIWAPIRAKLTTTDVATVLTANQATALVNLQVRNLTTNTPTVTVAFYNGTSRHYLAYQVTLASKGTYEFTMGAPMTRKETLEVSISADSADVIGTYVTQSQQ